MEFWNLPVQSNTFNIIKLDKMLLHSLFNIDFYCDFRFILRLFCHIKEISMLHVNCFYLWIWVEDVRRVNPTQEVMYLHKRSG